MSGLKFSLGIAGNSGCSVELVKLNSRLVVSKSTFSEEYMPRLRKQICIQKEFYEGCDKGVDVPQILKEEVVDGKYSAYMSYVSYNDFVDFFQTSNVNKIRDVMFKLCEFVSLNTSDNLLLVNEDISLKLNELLVKIPLKYKTNTVVEKLEKIKKIISNEEIWLPEGDTHGDLTFSNVLFSSSTNRICLIDFLDGYIDSPWLDVVKLRQDTHLYWSLRKIEKDYDIVRMKQMLDWVDCFIVDYFKMDPKLYALLQSINILRIFPYSTTDEEILFLENCLKNLEF